MENLTYNLSTNNQEENLLTELRFIQLELSNGNLIDISILEDNHKIIFKTEKEEFCEIITNKIKFDKKIPEKIKVKLNDFYEYYFKSSKSKISPLSKYVDFFNVTPIKKVIKIQHIFNDENLIIIEITEFKKGIKIKINKQYFKEKIQLTTETIFKLL